MDGEKVSSSRLHLLGSCAHVQLTGLKKFFCFFFKKEPGNPNKSITLGSSPIPMLLNNRLEEWAYFFIVCAFQII